MRTLPPWHVFKPAPNKLVVEAVIVLMVVPVAKPKLMIERFELLEKRFVEKSAVEVAFEVVDWTPLKF